LSSIVLSSTSMTTVPRARLVAVLAALTVLLGSALITAAPAAAQTVEIGGYYPAAVTYYLAGSPGNRATESAAATGTAAVTNYCHGSGSGYAPQIQISGGGAFRSRAYLNHDQTVWYRAWVERWDGSSAWAYYGGGRSWQSKPIYAWSSLPATFWGENVPVATGSWYRVVEQYVFVVNGTWIGEARNYFNEWAHKPTGASLARATGTAASSCYVR
jgi:hypothetical protein